jgi:nitric oxide reductase NorD protein
MEEIAGKIWDRFMHRLADTRHAHAAVTLAEISRTAGILFRALGGDAGLDVKAAQATEHGARRGWLQRLAGTGSKTELAWRDHEALYLPDEIALFSERSLNRDLYLWLIALATEMRPGDWFAESQRATLRVFERYPGFAPRYRQLAEAAIALRPSPDTLGPEEARQERVLRTALRAPGSVAALPAARRPWQPLPLWLHPSPPAPAAATTSPGKDPAPQAGSTCERVQDDPRRRSAERVDMPEGKDGFMLFFRAESILSWADYMRINRPTEDDEDSDPAAADDMKRLSLARDGNTTAARVRFDLDLPPAHADDTPLGPGIPLPEWHHGKRQLLPAHCRLQPMLATAAPPCGLPPQLAVTARRIRRQFEALTPGRVWLNRQFDGSEADLDACIEHAADRQLKRPAPERGLYRALRTQQRDLACLLLADLSRRRTPTSATRRASSTSSATRCSCSPKPCPPPATSSGSTASPRCGATACASMC